MPSFQNTISDDDVYDLVLSYIDEAESFSESLKGEREKVNKYYRGESDMRVRKGRSSAISPVVEKIANAVLVSVHRMSFARPGMADVIPENEGEVSSCEEASRYVQQEFERANGQAVIRNAILSSILNGTAYLLVSWIEPREIRISKYKSLGGAQVGILEGQEDTEIIDLEETDPEVAEFEIPGVGVISQEEARYNLALKQTLKKRGRIELSLLDVEDFFFDENAKDVKSNFLILGHTLRVRAGDLKDQGYPEDVVLDLIESAGANENKDKSTFFTPDLRHRNERKSEEDKSMVLIELKEAYIRMDLNGSGEPLLYRIVLSRGYDKIIEKELVDRTPYVALSMNPRTDTLQGESLVLKRCKEQDFQSMGKREWSNHISSLTSPRMSYVKGHVCTEDLQEESLGSLVRTTDPNAINVIPQGTIPPNLVETMKTYQRDTEDLSGVNPEGTAYNPENLTNVTTGAMNIAEDVSGTQISMYSNQVLEACADIFKLILYFTSENCDSGVKVFSVDTGVGEVDPRSWNSSSDVRPNTGISKGTNSHHQKVLESLMSMTTSVKEKVKPPFKVSSEQIVNAFKDYFSSCGIYNTSRYLTPFTAEEEQAMDDAAAQQAQQAQQGAGSGEGAYLQGEAIKAQTEAGKAQLKMQMELEKMRMEDDLKRDQMESEIVWNSLKLAVEQGIQVNPEPILELMERRRQYEPPVPSEPPVPVSEPPVPVQ